MRTDLLLELANHLESGKRGHRYFTFNHFNTYKKGPEPSGNKCGSCGCALGECPVLWPDRWEFAGPNLALDGGRSPESDLASEFFEISIDAALHLFYPDNQDTFTFGGKILGGNASRQEVAANIRAFVKKFE